MSLFVHSASYRGEFEKVYVMEVERGVLKTEEGCSFGRETGREPV